VGIGLALTQRLVKLQGGDIGVESERGKGSTFWFTIPQKNVVCEVGNGRDRSLLKGKEKSEKKSGGRQILVAEDNETNLSLILEMLNIMNHKVAVARDGQEALNIVISTKPELILIDVRMPKMDGLEVTRKLRQMSEFKDTPIIALTASAGKEAKQKCLDAGCTDYLAKPVKSKELFEMLEKYLK
jgi:CheY-like chemotaxis protein